MLKNKFGMTKILVLVLSVLMLVSLVACNKADGPSTDDMNAAIQAAIDAANAEQAAKEAALAASIAADKAAQEAKDAALAESIAKEKAENDAALKKAQEEAKAAADAAAAASKAAKEAADKAAKDAADAAAKAAKEAADKAAKEASEAAKKAQEAADKQASELAAALEAAKLEALKAAEEAAKAQAEASKAIEEAAKAAEEAAKAQAEASKAKEEAAIVSSQLAETTVVPETTVVAPAETTVAPETTTEAPVVPVDKTEVLVAYSKLKTEYTYSKSDMYLAEDYVDLVLLFDKASIDLNNAATVEAATAVLETLKVDVLAVRNVEQAAAEVADLVDYLGDIETEVFTTQAEKVVEAEEAYLALKSEYAKYFGYLADEKKFADTDVAVKKATALGINVADLNKASAKVDVLTKYIANSLQADLAKIYQNDSRFKFRVEMLNDPIVSGETDTWEKVIDRALYTYRVLSIVNGGDVAEADLAIAWDYLLKDDGTVAKAEGTSTKKPLALGGFYADGEKMYDEDKATAYFTAEDFVELYAMPTLEAKFDGEKNDVIKALKDALRDNASSNAYNTLTTQLATQIANKYVIIAADISYEFTNVVAELTDALDALSFVDDYKSVDTFDDAVIDLYTMAAVAYVDAVNFVTAESKAYAIENYDYYTYEVTVNNLDTKYSQDAYQNEVQQANYQKQLAQAAALKDAFNANVTAAPVYDIETLNALYVADETASKTTYETLYDMIDETGINAAFFTYANNAVINAIKDNFAAQSAADSKLGDFILALTADLEALRDRLDPKNLEANGADLYKEVIRLEKIGEKQFMNADLVIDYVGGEYYANTAKFEAMVDALNAAIAKIEAISEDDYKDEEKVLKIQDTKSDYDNEKKAVYWQSAEAKEAFMEAYNITTQAALEAKVHSEVNKDGKWTNTTYFTINKTAYPVTYTLTAADKACAAAETIYNDAFKAIHEPLITMMGYVADYQKKITSDAYNAILKSVAADPTLEAEVTAVAEAYKKYVETYTAFSYAMSEEFVDVYKTSDYLKKTHVTVENDFDNASKYDFRLVTDDAQKVVDVFETVFFQYGTDKKASNVITLYNYKKEAVSEITTAIAKYKNVYTPVAVATGAAASWNTTAALYQYDGITGAAVAVGSSSAKGQAYEAQLDALLTSYIAKINAVSLASAEGAQVKNALGDEILAKYASANFDKDGDGNNVAYFNAKGAFDPRALYTATGDEYYLYNNAEWKTVASATYYLSIIDQRADEDAEAAYMTLEQAKAAGFLFVPKYNVTVPTEFDVFTGADVKDATYYASKLVKNDDGTVKITYTKIDGNKYVENGENDDGDTVYTKINDLKGYYKFETVYVYDATVAEGATEPNGYVAATATTANDAKRYINVATSGDPAVYVEITPKTYTNDAEETVYVGIDGTTVYGKIKTSTSAETAAFKVMNLDAAKALVDAYVIDLLGYENTLVTAARRDSVQDRYDVTTVGSVKDVDSRVYTAYKTYWLGDFSAITLNK